jgi:hypothetical protein
MAEVTLPPEILASIAGRRLGFETAANTAKQRLGQDYNTGLYNLDQYANESGRGINDNFANKGTFLSGLRVDEQGRLAKNVGERKSKMSTDYTRGLQDVDQSLQAQLQSLIDFQNEQAQQYTRQNLNDQLAQEQAAAMAAQQQQLDALAAQQEQPQLTMEQIMAMLGEQPPPAVTGGGGAARTLR